MKMDKLLKKLTASSEERQWIDHPEHVRKERLKDKNVYQILRIQKITAPSHFNKNENKQ